MEDNKKIISVELTEEQYKFLTDWQKTHEAELGIEVPLTSMIRKAIDGTMKAQTARAERSDRPSGDRGGRPGGGKPGFGGDRGGRPSFGGGARGGRPGGRPGFGGGDRGGRPSMGRGPKFDMLPGKGKFEKKF